MNNTSQRQFLEVQHLIFHVKFFNVFRVSRFRPLVTVLFGSFVKSVRDRRL